MICRRRYRYLLDPSEAQEQVLLQWAGCARAVWNAALEQRILAWELRSHSVSYQDQCAELPAAKAALPWLSEPHSDVLSSALWDLNSAFKAFFERRSRYPNFRAKGIRNDRFRVYDRGGKGPILVERVSRAHGRVRIPKLGWIRFRWSREPAGRITSVTVKRDALGWHVSVSCEQEIEAPTSLDWPVVGVDRGVVATIATSSGQVRSCPALSPGEAERLRRLRRKAGRQETARRSAPPSKRRRSARHRRTLEQIARLEAKRARIGRDFRHKITTELSRRNGVVVLERLNVVALTRSARGSAESPGRRVRAKASLNRSIRGNGWGELRSMLDYKLVARGGRLVEVNAAGTSQRCAECGHVDAQSRVSRGRFHCVACGHADDADVNAARNIRAAGLAVSARGALCTSTAPKREPRPPESA